MLEHDEMAHIFRFSNPGHALELAQEISIKQDRSIVPFLLQTLREVRSDQESGEPKFADAAEERRVAALEMAIISLSTIEQTRELLKLNELQSESLVDHKLIFPSVEEYWNTRR